MQKHLLFLILGLVYTLAANAQTKIKDGSVIESPTLPNTNAILELESNNKGLLLPRVELSGTLAATPITAHIAGMTVYNTATAGDVTPGYYYNDGTQWVRLSGNSAANTEPWNVQGGTIPAVSNTESIYQTGSVAIGKNTAVNGAMLDVNGAVRGGSGSSSAVGVNSIAVGDAVSASGPNTAAFGQNNKASADGSTALGLNNTAKGMYSLSTGSGNVSSTINETVLGRFNADTTSVNTASWSADDALLQVGNGASADSRSNAITVLKKGYTAIGTHDAKPNSTLHVFGSVSAPIRSVTQSTALTENDYTIVCRHSTAITITFPDPATCPGRMYYIINNGTQSVTTNYPFEVATGVTQSAIPVAVSGVNSPNPNFGQKYLLQSDGTRWVLISLG